MLAMRSRSCSLLKLRPARSCYHSPLTGLVSTSKYQTSCNNLSITCRNVLAPSGRRASSATGLRKVVVTSRAFPETLQLLESASLQVVANDCDEPWPAEVLASHAAEADALMCFMPDTIDSAFLARCPQLKIIGCALKGFDNFDVQAATDKGVWITYVPGLLTEPTAELAVGLIIGAGRNLLAGDSLVRSGKYAGWRPVLYGRGLHRATVGIWGFGAVGQAIAARLSGFGCAEIRIHDVANRSKEAAELGCIETDMLGVLRSDVVVSAVPLLESTRHGISQQAIAEMTPNSLLVNISRGSVVDEAAVAAALRTGLIGGYAADVFEFEDWALPDRPRCIAPELLSSPNTLFTPHLGSAVVEVRKAIECSAASTIVQWARGEQPDNVLNRV
eukprot:gnl/TRDRNA2_/TRDRNA2_199595_c0_seq1.p1 gnl/TRDRNA2_/TRDRNA2_199595_c0~~gnl/TRDRNA2_/TRDRNA2_199595_c0_seq1.p1  ORF type:complete len:389 (+),score=52.01 gnl/TRDRNA2_/TRDRNA2_199595_c0_seq1:73-1239(+)